jgi:hypothetical protein
MFCFFSIIAQVFDQKLFLLLPLHCRYLGVYGKPTDWDDLVKQAKLDRKTQDQLEDYYAKVLTQSKWMVAFEKTRLGYAKTKLAALQALQAPRNPVAPLAGSPGPADAGAAAPKKSRPAPPAPDPTAGPLLTSATGRVFGLTEWERRAAKLPLAIARVHWVMPAPHHTWRTEVAPMCLCLCQEPAGSRFMVCQRLLALNCRHGGFVVLYFVMPLLHVHLWLISKSGFYFLF